jgi:hypothetical protein
MPGVAKFSAVNNSHLVTGTGDILNNMGGKNDNPFAAQFDQQISEPDSFRCLLDRLL